VRRSVIAIAVLSLSAVACGWRAVSKASEQVKNATSVRLRVEDKRSGTRTIDAVCPDKVRIKADTTSGPLEIVAIGKKALGRTGDSRWISVPMSFVNVPPVCSGATWAQSGKDLAGILADMMDLQVTEVPIGPREVSGVPCQDWEAREAGPDPHGTRPRIRLCLAVDNFRLMELGLPDATWTFSEWNAPFDISFPRESGAEPRSPAS
jgi:hypothetical protein